jgi:HK97 family phage major capsid protein
MNRKQLLKLLKGLGYDGKADLPEIKSWLTEQGYDPEDFRITKGGKVEVLELETVWKKAPAAAIVDADADEDELRLKAAEDALKSLTDEKRLAAKNHKGAAADADLHEGGQRLSAKAWVDRSERKAYDRKAASGLTVFPDAEMAEVAGAHIRLKIAGLTGKDYPKRQSDLDILRKSAVEYDNNLGGALVPVEVSNYLVSLKEAYGDPRGIFRSVPMSRDVQTFPKDTADLAVYAPGEGGTITPSDPQWTTVSLTAKKLAVLTTVSSELLNDSVFNVAEIIPNKMRYAFRKAEEQAFFIGDGTSTHYGFHGIAAALKALSATIANIAGLVVGTGNEYSELTLADFESVAGRLPDFEGLGGDPEWFVNKRFYFEVMVRLALASGGVTAAEVEGRRTPMFLGYKVNFIRSMPRTQANSQVCALFGWPKLAATMGDVLGGISVAQSEHRYFDQDLIAFRGIERVAFQAHDIGNASATESLRTPGPVVGLITAAS